MKEPIKLFSGTANRELAQKVAKHLKLPLAQVEIKKFSDGEIYTRLLESVRGCDVFIIQPTCPDVNSNLMELLILVDALKRSSPARITAVIPYFGYSRQDRKARPREPISAKVVAKMLETTGINLVMTFDLHVPQVQGFFDIPSDNLDLIPVYASHIMKKGLKNVVFVSPDVGGVVRTRAMASAMQAPIAIIDKRRPEHGVVKVENVIGDVKGKIAILVDDIIDTAGTITAAAKLLKQFGAKEVYALATHALLSGPAIERLKNSEIKQIITTNTVPLSKEKQISKMDVIDISSILAETIKRQHEGTSMHVVYEDLHKKLQQKK